MRHFGTIRSSARECMPRSARARSAMKIIQSPTFPDEYWKSHAAKTNPELAPHTSATANAMRTDMRANKQRGRSSASASASVPAMPPPPSTRASSPTTPADKGLLPSKAKYTLYEARSTPSNAIGQNTIAEAIAASTFTADMQRDLLNATFITPN
jgi:hypothetical protein